MENVTVLEEFYPRIARIDATWRCNLNCKHCQTGMFRGPNHPRDLDTVEMCDLFDQLADMGTRYIGLLGGEPMLRRDLGVLLEKAKDREILMTITTNGTCMTEEWAVSLMRYGCNVTVSVDGASRETHEFIRGRGTWKSVTAALARLQAAKEQVGSDASIGISAVLHQRNKHEASRFLLLADEFAVDRLILSAVHRVGNAELHWDDLSLSTAEQYELAYEMARLLSGRTRERCSVQVNFHTPIFRELMRGKYGLNIPQISQFDQAGLSECYVQCDGRVFPSQKCSEMVPDVLIGAAEEIRVRFRDNNIRKKRLSDIWYGEDFNRYRKMMLQKEYMRTYSTCSKCPMSKTYCIPTAAAFLLDESKPQPLCTEPLIELGHTAREAAP